MQGRPRLLDGAAERAQAVVSAMLPGPHGGTAVAEVLLGDTNPSGRLPLTYPKYAGLQLQHWHKVTQQCNAPPSSGGGGFLSSATAECPVQWPFGRGLSYTTFRYSEVRVSESLVTHRVGAPGRFELLVTVTNTGSVAGRHTVLAFVVRRYQTLVTPDSTVKVPPWQCPSSAPAAPQGAAGGSGQLCSPRERPSHWAPRPHLGDSSELPPKSPMLPPLTL